MNNSLERVIDYVIRCMIKIFWGAGVVTPSPKVILGLVGRCGLKKMRVDDVNNQGQREG